MDTTSAHEAVADAIASSLPDYPPHDAGSDTCLEEDATVSPSRFRVEIPWSDGHTYYAIIYRDDEKRPT